jgi:hypothetical protein
MKIADEHIPFELLANLAEGRTDREHELMAHLTDCSQCNGKLERLAHVINLMRTDSTEAAPRDVIAQATSIFTRREARPSLLRRIVAAVTFDSASSTPAYGYRSGQTASRQILFAAEDSDIDLRLSRQADQWLVSGQVLGAACAGAEVELSDREKTTLTRLNDLCEFNLSAVPAGSYKLTMRFEDRQIEIPDLELGG